MPASGPDKTRLATGSAGNLGIVTTYNDMLSAHQPFERYPDLIRDGRARGWAAPRRSQAACPRCAMASPKARRGWN